MKQATIVPDGKVFKLMLGTHELGQSKTDSDARFHMHAINEALDEAYQEGRDHLTETLTEVVDDYVEKVSQPTKGGGVCRVCGGPTTYARQNSASGKCFKCEHLT